MFYVFSKLLPLLVYPAGLACCLLVLSLVLRKRPGWPSILTVAGLLVLGLSGNRLVSMSLLRTLEWRTPSLQDTALPQADVIVVLGGGTRQQLSPRPWHEVGEAGDRILYAAHLYRAGVAPVVLVSGGYGSLSNPGVVPESGAMADMLVSLGVPRHAIVLESHSRNTRENAVESTKILEASGWERVVLVTSALHMPRARGTFAKLGVSVIPAPTDFLLTYSDWSFYRQANIGIQLMNLLPKAEYMEVTEKALKELIGIAVYRLRDWL